MEQTENIGTITWQSPSNIALTKYWGKYGNQLPKNPSLSFTLNNAQTTTSIRYSKRSGNFDGISLSFQFEGEQNESFRNRIVKFIETNIEHLDYLKQVDLHIASQNSFPHSSGIASSASSMSALVCGFCSLEEELSGHKFTPEEFRKKASFLSRLASGSACRSLYPKAAIWGISPSIVGSSLEFAVGVQEHLHPNFVDYHDDILIVSSKEKSVSSSQGHQLMETNRFAPERFAQAHENTEKLIDILRSGDLFDFVQLVEAEALTLHALMMTSNPSFILMESNTVAIIKKLQQFRSDTDIPICFTLDAGPNVHVLYAKQYAVECQSFIETNLKPLCFNGRIIHDRMGDGAKKIIQVAE